MRVVLNPQLAIGQIDIERIPLDPQSRDDIPAVLRGLQQIWSDAELRAKAGQPLSSWPASIALNSSIFNHLGGFVAGTK